ncbi:MAG: Rrf2 family transcriptional regulator [Tissierellia bacterium]|nr:Rrf2 family transcriptional regulator [Tissierellia bacterium]
MKLTTRSRYGLRAVYYLKQHYKEGPVSLPSLVRDLNLSQNYLEQLFIKLKKSNIVKSKRGKFGGYILSRDPKKISVGEIIRALEGDIDYSSDCHDHDNCDMIDCITRHVFIKIDLAVNDVIDNMTLADI